MIFCSKCIDDYGSARRKITKATFTSDLESQADDSQSDSMGHRKKRKTVSTTFTRFSSFEVTDSEPEDACSILQPPPKYKGNFFFNI